MNLQDRFKSTEKRKNAISVYLDGVLLQNIQTCAQAWGCSRNDAIIQILKSYMVHAGVNTGVKE